MNTYFKTAVTFFSILLIASFVYFTITKPSKTKPVNPACGNMDIAGVKEGVIVHTEDEGRVVYVSKDWELIPMEGKEEIGYWLALCRSPDERVEIRSAETKEKIRKFVIDLHYKATHGLPTKP